MWVCRRIALVQAHPGDGKCAWDMGSIEADSLPRPYCFLSCFCAVLMVLRDLLACSSGTGKYNFY